MISLLENYNTNILKPNALDKTNLPKNQLLNVNLVIIKLLLKNINKSIGNNNGNFNKIKKNILMDAIKNKSKYEIIILDVFNQIDCKITIDDLKLLKNVNKFNIILNLSFENIYELIIKEKIKQSIIKINLNNYWNESLFGKIENNNIRHSFVDNNLIILLNSKSFIIMYGNKHGCSKNNNVFEPTNIIYKSSKGKNTIIRQNSNGNIKEIYKEDNGLIVKNDTRMGKINPENKIVWKVANILGTTNNCIIKLRLLDSSKFIRPIDLEYIYRGKCRCDSAYVEEIQEYNFNEEKPLENVIGMGIKGFKYEVGKIVYSDSWNDDIYTSCTNGIHVLEKREDLKKFMNGVIFNIENEFNFNDV